MEIIDVERKFEKALDGMTIRGTIVASKNMETGSVRVLDYKTSSKAKKPSETHWECTGRNAMLKSRPVCRVGSAETKEISAALA